MMTKDELIELPDETAFNLIKSGGIDKHDFLVWLELQRSVSYREGMNDADENWQLSV